MQRGTVTSVSDGTLVVHSSDGFDQTWTTGKDTRYVLGGAFARGPMAARPARRLGRAVRRSPPRPHSRSASSVARARLSLVLGRANGTKPGATLVVSGPALMGGPGGDQIGLVGGIAGRWVLGCDPGMGSPLRQERAGRVAQASGSGLKA